MLTRRRALSIVLLATLLAGAAGMLVFSQFGQVWLGRALVDEINRRLPGQLRLDGELHWQLFPPALRLTNLAWTPPDGLPGELTIAQISARSDATDTGARPVEIRAGGVNLALHQLPDGSWALPPLAATGEDGAVVDWRLAGVHLTDSRLSLHPRHGAVVVLDLAAADVVEQAGGDMGFTIDAQVSQGARTIGGRVEGRYRLADRTLADVALRLQGAVDGVAVRDARIEVAQAAMSGAGVLTAQGVRLSAQGEVADQRVEASAQVPTLQASDGRIDATVSELTLRRPLPEAAMLRLDDARIAFDGHAVRLAPLTGEVTLEHPRGAVAVTLVDGRADYGVGDGRLDFALPILRAQLPDPAEPARRLAVDGGLSGALAATGGEGAVTLRTDEATLNGRWWWTPQQSRWLGGEVHIDRLDLDRWLPRSSGSDAQPAPLDAWRDLPLALEVQVGVLRWQGVTMRDARLRLNAPEASASR